MTNQKQKNDYQLQADGSFVIRNYNQKKPFANFLPGIAGLYGTPMWAFYVNRGQGMASFGTTNKDGAILEFYPANKAYQMTTLTGFRTFIKYRSAKSGKADFAYYEPFRQENSLRSLVEQKMEIASHEFAVCEKNPRIGLETRATFFTIPDEPLAALARELALTNISEVPIQVEILDGLPVVYPYGMNQYFIKEMSRTIEAWMIAENLERQAPFFRLKVDASDRPEVAVIHEGNFFFSCLHDGSRTPKLLRPLVDPSEIFGAALDFTHPQVFDTRSPFVFPSSQAVSNKTPCAFSFGTFEILPGKTKHIQSFFGHSQDLKTLNGYLKRALGTRDYFANKRQQNRQIIESVKAPLFTVSASRVYDLYCGQTYLDNVMRGGMPLVIEGPARDAKQAGGAGEKAVLYVYSRKHGDLERDYNRFVVEPTYYSQGNGNFRDVNQNRRNDVWFEPKVGDANVRTFYNLIQLDGFNPLMIKGTDFHFRRSSASQ
jgi:hypothetical protein